MIEFDSIKDKLPSHKDMSPYYEDLFTRDSQCDTVIEFGIHIGNSTVAILCAQPKKWIGYDPIPMLGDNVMELVADGNTEFVVEKKSSLDADFEEADMLFIDSLHMYSFLCKELALHAHKIKKYIGFHDTKLMARASATGQDSHGTYVSIPADTNKGLMDAIEEFLADHPEWVIDKHNEDGIWGCLWLKRI